MQEYCSTHVPVLLTEVIASLSPHPGEKLLDATLGLAGHARALIDITGGELIGFDADERNLALAREKLDMGSGRITLIHDNFRSVREHVAPRSVDMVLMDLGISSPHLDDASRGFSFQAEGPLDMRLDASTGLSAEELLSRKKESEIADILYRYGEIHSSRKLAAAIVTERKKERITTTTRLAEIVKGSVGRGVLPQAFQALRIAVNGEAVSCRWTGYSDAGP